MDIDWNDWELIEYEEENDFTFVYIDSLIEKGVLIKLGVNEDGNTLLFNDVITSGWSIDSFIEIKDNEYVINNDIYFFEKETKRWTSLEYKKFVRKYPQFKID